MRILICGGRDYGENNKAEVEAFINAWALLIEKHGSEFEVLNGGCKTGADKLARGCAAVGEYTCITEPAKWAARGKAAGPERNQRMIDKWKPDAAVAFPGGVGTADMVRRLRAASIPVWIPYGGVNE